MTAPDPYAHSVFHGKLLDNATIAALKIAEQKLGYELTILQGIGGATASAGTHTEGRAVDLSTYDAARKLRVLKDIGFAVWEREDLPGVWSEHLHGILIFENRQNSRGLNDVGFRQIAAFDAKRDGLKSNLPDNSYRPDPKAVFTRAEYEGTFVVPVPRIQPTHVTKARDRLVEAIHAAGQAAVELEAAGEHRAKAKAQILPVREHRRGLKAALEALPER